MHICHESNKTVTGPISARIVALYHQNRQIWLKSTQIGTTLTEIALIWPNFTQIGPVSTRIINYKRCNLSDAYNLFAGIGVGLNIYSIFESGVDKEYALPIFINAKAYLPVSPQTDFFASLDCGYWFGISSNLKEVGGLMLTPSVGVCFDLGKSYGLNLSLGYNHQNWSADGPVSLNTGAIGIKVGFSF